LIATGETSKVQGKNTALEQAVRAKSEVKPFSVFSYTWFKTVPPKGNFACIGLNQRNQRMIHIQIMKLRPLMLSNGFHNERDRIF